MNEDLTNNTQQNQENSAQTWESNDNPMRSGILMVVVCVAAFIIVSFFGGGGDKKSKTEEKAASPAAPAAEVSATDETPAPVQESAK